VLPSRLDVQFGKVGLQVADTNADETANEVVFLGSDFVQVCDEGAAVDLFNDRNVENVARL
jgi:hypothetical protein